MSRVSICLPRRAMRSVSCAAQYQSLCLPRPHASPATRHTPKQQQRHRSTFSENQAIPLTGYYAELIDQPAEKVQPATRTAPEAPTPESLPKTEKEQTLERARVVFGSRLAGPGERQRDLDAASRNIAGILVPPKPTEPDNCCMSGCVNCVWDLYRDEIEDWAAKSAEARTLLQAQRAATSGTGSMAEDAATPSHVATSMDDDGGGSETNWEVGQETSAKDDDLFAGVPVGIREFMRTEKMLKTKLAGLKKAD